MNKVNTKFTRFSFQKVFIYRFQFVLIVSTLFVLDWSSAWKQSQAIATEVCVQPIGRVYSPGDLNFPVGSQICPRDRINPIKGRTVTALCYLNGKFLYIKQSGVFDAPKMCTPLDTPLLCTGREPSRCNSAKGPSEEQNVPTLISPYGSSMLSTRPLISWYTTLLHERKK